MDIITEFSLGLYIDIIFGCYDVIISLLWQSVDFKVMWIYTFTGLVHYDVFTGSVQYFSVIF